MPPKKRPLGEVEGNASQPQAKRASSGKENGATGKYKGMSKAELSALCRRLDLQVSGNKAALVQRLLEAEKNPSGAENVLDPLTKITTPESENPHSETATIPVDFKWICMCAQDRDESEDDESEDGSTEDEASRDEDEEPHGCGAKDCVCKKPFSEVPNHKWIITEDGFKSLANLQHEADFRDQDVWGLYFYNDFTGYGFQEVVENHLVSFNKEMSKKECDPAKLWGHVESLAFFIPGPGLWWHIDHCDLLCETLRLIGFGVLSVIDIFDQAGLLKPESPVKNLTLVLGTLILEMDDWPGGPGEDDFSWTEAIVERLHQHNIRFDDPPRGINKRVEVEKLRGGHPQTAAAKKLWKTFTWKGQYASFCKRYRSPAGGANKIGGRAYDLTLATVRKRAEPWSLKGADIETLQSYANRTAV